MSILPHDKFPEFIATKRAAEILGRSPATLKRWRYEGTGPEYVEIEGRVRYDVRVLLDYIKKNTRVPSVRAAMEETRGTVSKERLSILLV
jgi:predicted site-specific integrase-resolvase